MLMAVLIAIQASATPADPRLAGFDLAAIKPPAGCDAAGSDIVVCGRSEATRARVKGVPQGVEAPPALPKAEIGVIGALRATAETEAVGVGGFPSNRVMLRLKMPF
jgi:hypothetical protein